MTHEDVSKPAERINATLEIAYSSAGQMCDNVVDILAPYRQVTLCTNDGAKSRPLTAKQVGLKTPRKSS